MESKLTPKLDADLERRVAERTAQLATANEQLQTQITERKRAEEALRESRQLLERTLYSLQDAAFVLDAKTVEIVECNPAASQMFGYHRDELLGRTTDFLHVDRTALEEFRTHLYSAVQDLGSLHALEFSMKRVDGTIFPTEHSVTPLTDERGNRTGWVSVVRDITERKQAQEAERHLLEEVRAAHTRLQALSQQLIEAQESEKQRLSWELHDETSQSLTALIMQLGAARGLLPEASDRAEAILEGAEALAKTTLEGVRRMIAGLRPPALDDFGLIPALRRLGDELREDAGVDVAVEASSLSDRLPPPLETALFRIAQEALTNIHKHAQAQHAMICLQVERERVTLLVKDDGVGLRSQRDRARRRGDVLLPGGWVVLRGHYGLVGMQERAALLGGAFQVQSAPGEGTTLRVELPR